MLKYTLVLLLFMIGCSNPENKEVNKNDHEHHSKETAPALQLNNGNKWNADEPTMNNVAEIKQLVNDSRFAEGKNLDVLANELQGKVDNLISQCKMQGPDHDALHVWLEKVLQHIKELKEPNAESQAKAHTALKEDIVQFEMHFE